MVWRLDSWMTITIDWSCISISDRSGLVPVHPSIEIASSPGIRRLSCPGGSSGRGGLALLSWALPQKHPQAEEIWKGQFICQPPQSPFSLVSHDQALAWPWVVGVPARHVDLMSAMNLVHVQWASRSGLSAVHVLPWPKKRTILEIRGKKNAVPSCDIMLDDARSAQGKSRGQSRMALPCVHRASSSMISQDRTAFFLPRISRMVLFFGQGSRWPESALCTHWLQPGEN